MAKTRGVFTLILVKNDAEKKLLLSERQDGKGWNLPGGRVEEGESDFDALIREVREETGLDIEPLEQVGPLHVFNEDTAVAYVCTVTGGQLIPTKEAKQHRYVDKEEIKTLTLVGPVGRLGRTGRMAWDGLSIMEEPTVGPNEVPEDMLPIEGLFASDDGCLLVDETNEGRKTWPRLDPYSPTAKMEPAKAQ
jgi:8-oxo-dGTP pyrophosphatase MutT (NUDIX family)